jgi:signal transduction histidine kinase
VKDSGVGIAPEVQKILFEKTTGYSTRGTANEKGTGLGLILCKEFVERIGGKIWLESELGKGSTFFFTVKKG